MKHLWITWSMPLTRINVWKSHAFDKNKCQTEFWSTRFHANIEHFAEVYQFCIIWDDFCYLHMLTVLRYCLKVIAKSAIMICFWKNPTHWCFFLCMTFSFLFWCVFTIRLIVILNSFVFIWFDLIFKNWWNSLI